MVLRGPVADVHEPCVLDGRDLLWGLVTNSPALKWTTENTAETLFDRLEAHRRTWKVYVLEPARISFTGWIHMPPVKDRLATHFVPFSEFERDAANGTLPDFCLIEPHLVAGHGDYHPAEGRSLMGHDYNIAIDPPSSILAGESFLDRIYRAIKTADSTAGSNAYNTTFFIGWDEPGGTYDHVPPGPDFSTGSQRARGTMRLQVRPLGLPRTGDHRLSLDRRRDSGQRRVPPHLSCSPRCARSGASATRSPPATPPPARSIISSPAAPRATPPPGPTSSHSRCPNGSSPRSSSARSAISARRSAPASSSTPNSPDILVPALLADPDHPPTPTQLVDFIFGIAAKYFPRLVPDDTDEAETYR